MEESFKAVKLTDRVYWVGAIDWAIRDFHGYSTPRGSTYNAYLILADKVTLVDTVKPAFREEMMARIASVIDPTKIDYIISNHAEMDHSGSLPQVIADVRPEKVFCSTNGLKALAAHFHLGDVFTAVKDGETLSLGNMHATFLETRMLHWPDSMVTWLAEEGVLFSQDGFGQHLATSERWADQLDPALLRREAAKYYANILLPFSAFVVRLAERMQSLALPVRILAPDHGPLYRKDIGWIVDLWATWAAQKPEPKAVILYDTMWQSTATMARAVAEGLAAGGAATVRVLPARESHRSDVAAEILEAGALVLGSPTINGGIFPSLGDPLTYLEGLKRQHLIGAAFGSYGWSGEAVGKLEAWLRTAKVDVVAEGLKIQYVPDEAGLARAKAWGEKIGQALRERCAANRSV